VQDSLALLGVEGFQEVQARTSDQGARAGQRGTWATGSA
jgi:hypothetical protein